MTPADIIAGLRLIQQKLRQGWCQHVMARDKNGAMCHYLSSDAVCWCIHGASQATGVVSQDVFTPIMKLTNSEGDYAALTSWNDAPGRTQADVIAMLDQAIASVQTEVPL